MLVGLASDKKIFVSSIMSTFSFIKPRNGLWKEAKIAKVHARILDTITNLPA